MATPTWLDRAGRWFLNSGIQEPGGGVARYYRAEEKRNLPISTEITGYAASTLLYLHALTGDGAYRERGLAAARFLTEAWDAERQAIPFECGSALTYFFDCGIVARGLLVAWRETGDARFLSVARACGQSMARDFAGSNSDYHPILQLPQRQPLARDERWSRSPGCYQLKSAMAWRDLGGPEFKAHYQRVLDFSLRTCGAFLHGERDPQRRMDRLHAYCYFLEGLLPCAQEPVGARAICEGVGRVARYLREIAPTFARSDVYAQLLRMRIFADWCGITPVDRSAAECEASQLAAFQIADEDPRVDGGFAFGRKEGAMVPHINPVSTAFGLQALALWESYQAGGPTLDRAWLI